MALDRKYFKRSSNSQLFYQIQEIRDVMKVAATWNDNGVGGNKYADQLHAAVEEQNSRNPANTCQCCGRRK